MYRVKKWWIHGDSSLFNKIKFLMKFWISPIIWKKPHKLFGESKIDCNLNAAIYVTEEDDIIFQHQDQI